MSDKDKFLESLFTVGKNGRVKSTNVFFNRYLYGLYKKYSSVLSWEEVISVAVFETVRYMDRFTPENNDWEGMTKGTNEKNIKQFFSGLNTTVNFAVFWEANPNTIQKRKNKTKTEPSYSFYVDIEATTLDSHSDAVNDLESHNLQELIGEENKLPYAQQHETEQVNSLVSFIMNPENREKHFGTKFNERYKILCEHELDKSSNREEIMNLAGLSSNGYVSSIINTMKKEVERVAKKLDLKEERVAFQENRATRKSLLYYEYFDLLNSLEPEEEVRKLSEWVKENELPLDKVLYSSLNVNQCQELTRLFRDKDKLSKSTLYSITDTLYIELEKELNSLLNIAVSDRTLNEYKVSEIDFKAVNGRKVNLSASGMYIEK